MSRRTIIVGDVHGCAQELHRLLDRVQFASGDHLVLVGDLIARGPDSRGVLQIVRETGASLVRGNHEDRVLSLAGDTRSMLPHACLGRELGPDDLALLRAAPLWLALETHAALVVHAGIRPDLGMYAQHDNDLLTLRHVKQGDSQVLWGSLYPGPTHIVFGHHALAGLQLHPFATGLDTGCVYGKTLTALVLNEGEPVPTAVAARRKNLVQVKAARVYFDPKRPGTD
jgi:diadenosine tetraphosphatase ApaH/serine/threonine PP2A family protein phosphatase